MKTIAPTKRKNAICWSPAEVAFAGDVLMRWNRIMGDVRKAYDKRRNRFAAVQFHRRQQAAPDAERFSPGDIDSALQAYRRCPANEQLASWKSFHDFFSDGEEMIHAQLARTGQLRKRTPPPTPDELARRAAAVAARRRRVEALKILQTSPWPGYCRRARAESRTVRAVMEADLQQAKARLSIALNRRAADYERSTGARIADRLQQLAKWEALSPDSHDNWLNIGAAVLRDSGETGDDACIEGLAIHVFLEMNNVPKESSK